MILLLATVLIVVSALCSGLNVALMSLDTKNLKLKSKLGDKRAAVALNIRKNTHLSLAAILLTNVAVISATSLVLSQFLNGVLAGVLSTLLIVVFGEILPQAFAVRYALFSVSFFAPFLTLITWVSYPVSKPLQLLLDKVVGANEDRLHSRRELGVLIADHHDENLSELDDDEVEIVQNALLLSEKRVKEIMVPIKRVFYLKETDSLNAKKIADIKKKGFSRIPILSKKAAESNRFILVKDLIDIDFDERSYKVSELKTRPAVSVGSMTALDTLFRKFIAAKSHMMFVENRGKIVGIVTIEDLIEEIIGHEIEDETDS